MCTQIMYMYNDLRMHRCVGVRNEFSIGRTGPYPKFNIAHGFYAKS